jgi:hypothetical protein
MNAASTTAVTFVSPLIADTNNITNTPVTVLNANAYTLVVSSIVLCNTSSNQITVNLKRVATMVTPISSNFLIRNKPLALGESIDIIQYLGGEKTLPYASTDAGVLTTALICYTTGINQTMDCSIDYTILYETGA